MHRLVHVLKQQVLPWATVGKGNIYPLPPGAAYSGPSEKPFIEAYPYSSHRHNFFEGMWMLSGQAHIKIDGALYALEAGDFCFLPPQMLHADLYSKETRPYQSMWVSYRPDIVGAHMFSYEPVGKWNVVTYCTAAGSPNVASVLLALQHELAEQAPYSAEARRSLLVQIVVWLLRALEPACLSEGTRALPGHASQRALAYLRAHYAENVLLNDVARAAYLSPNYLAAVFKQETGKTVMDALTDIRIERARQLLLEDRLTVQEVAANVGYTSPHHFSRLFRRVAGIPPSRYGK